MVEPAVPGMMCLDFLQTGVTISDRSVLFGRRMLLFLGQYLESVMRPALGPSSKLGLFAASLSFVAAWSAEGPLL